METKQKRYVLNDSQRTAFESKSKGGCVIFDTPSFCLASVDPYGGGPQRGGIGNVEIKLLVWCMILRGFEPDYYLGTGEGQL